MNLKNFLFHTISKMEFFFLLIHATEINRESFISTKLDSENEAMLAFVQPIIM